MGIKFSVIIPIYKVDEYLEECVDSIIHQTYESFEIILVDDGSQDKCPAICDRYAETDPRVRVIHKENGGLVSARQAGAKIAAGEYVCCVDGDDWIAPDYLEKMEAAIAEYDADVVCCNHYYAAADGNKKKNCIVPPGLYDRERIERELFPILLEDERNRYFPSSIWAKAIRRNMYCEEQAAVDSAVVIGEDRMVEIPCVYRSNCVVMLADCLYYYRVNMNSMTKAKKGFSWKSMESFSRHIPKRLDLARFDFQAQFDRLVAHLFFLTAKSQFNRDESYRVIRREILEKMNIPEISGAIKRCRFSGSVRAKAMEYCLKLHLVWPMWAFQRLINIRRTIG